MVYNKEHMIEALRILEEILPSLDRIGSCSSSEPPEVQAKITNDFIDDWDVCRKLARVRSILSLPFDDGELEVLMADVPHWHFDARYPPGDTRFIRRK